ncbi:tRNA (cytidine(34)-2'-O)-methyltransferase [uncultured Anaerococcus sp.]|uniref:tRNA (cytidine(34)-2'-O)-methyltransferase n=1 Tax=uncultured Anaerococcus sp. TaxID=293428 RepID=UPI002614F4B9|nr:tRNA (cytidine(34)-2'-O)-methyltransferase [uncultured Anaerococcus sp.]
MFNIVLLMPEHPGNVGNIARTCVLTESRLHLVRPFKFNLSDKYLKKAGIDYRDQVDLIIHDSLDEFMEYLEGKNFYLLETPSENRYVDVEFKDGDYLIFGREKEGIDESFIKAYKDKVITIPMTPNISRSLNLANSVSIVLYEALRQIDFKF